MLADAIETSEALGRSVIVRRDAELSVDSSSGLVVGSFQWFLCDDNAVRISYDLIPDDVLKYIRFKALTIAGVEDGTLLQAVKDQIERSIRDGKDFLDFKGEVNRIFESAGVTKLSHNHLQTVFRTNIFSSYSVAQLAQVDSMRDRFPVWRYVAIKDNRTRPLHRELDGRIFRVGEGPIPPIDYNCRCVAQYLHTTEVQNQGLVAQDWSGNPQVVRFNTRGAFESWVKDNQTFIKPATQAWIDDQL